MCQFDSKCSFCPRNSAHKHASGLHEILVRSKSTDLGAAAEGIDCGTVGTEGELDNLLNSEKLSVRKLRPDFNGALLRTSAVRVVYPQTGKSTLAFAQHDAGSQATLISERLKTELGLGVKRKAVVLLTLTCNLFPIVKFIV